MSTDAPESTAHARTTALLIAAVAVIACGLPFALPLGLRDGIAVAVGMLAAAAFGAAAVRGLQRPRDPFPALLDAVPGAVFIIAAGRLQHANAAARALLGDTTVPVGTITVSELFHGEGLGSVIDGPGSVECDLELHAPDGRRRPVHVVAKAHGGMRVLLVVDRHDGAALAARMEHQRIELETLARRLMTVQEDERAALSRELHDDIGQAITAIKLSASSLGHEPDPPRHAVVQETAHEIAQIADQTVAKLRDLSLLLRPPQLDALGLEAALRWQAGALFRSEYPRLELDIPPLDCRPPREVELACFRIAQEALTNVLRHARAGRVVLRLECDDDELHLRVEDDGCGVAVDHHAGLGLITMRERALQLGGRLELESRPGRTVIDARLPMPATPDARRGALRG